MADTIAYREPAPSLVTICHVTYALHALGLAIGAFGTATVVGAFLFGWPSIIAVIINYVKRGEARGTWLESHFSWQIRTFWFALLWACLIGIAGFLLAIVLWSEDRANEPAVSGALVPAELPRESGEVS